jgi:secretory phospholipase A2
MYSRKFLLLLLCIFFINASHTQTIPEEDEILRAEKEFAQRKFDHHKKHGGVVCHKGTTSVQSMLGLESNGCTGADFLQMDGKEDFTYCCDIHDACYQLCGMARKKCDEDFKKCMNNMCTTTFSGNEKCKGVANMYYFATSALGQTFFEDSQSKHCECVDMRASIISERYSTIMESLYTAFAPDNWEKVKNDIENKYKNEYKSSAKKWGNMLYSIYRKYDQALIHIDGRELKTNVPKPLLGENKKKRTNDEM